MRKRGANVGKKRDKVGETAPPANVTNGAIIKRNVIDVLVEKCVPNAENPNTMDAKTFNRLVEDIKRNGFVEPIQVWPTGDGRYEIIGGEHRWRAASYLGMTMIPGIEFPEFDADRRNAQMVRWNILKGKLDPVKFARLFDRLSATYGADLTKDMMAFSDQAAFDAVYKQVVAGLPGDLGKKVKGEKKAARTVDDLALILNRLFNEYGHTLDHNFMWFTYGGQIQLMVLLTPKALTVLQGVTAKCSESGQNMNDWLIRAIEALDVAPTKQ